jgi:hypothetical protein
MTARQMESEHVCLLIPGGAGFVMLRTAIRERALTPGVLARANTLFRGELAP